MNSLDGLSAFDAKASLACDSLCLEFGLSRSDWKRCSGEVSLGIEVEVPWSSYFPQLWKKYGLENRRIAELSKQETESLSKECSVLEEVLRPRLHRTEACGIPRGNDRYWEFALRPVNDVQLLVEQVRLLTEANLLPRDRKHSLHVTVGGIPRCSSLYYLSMLLEAEFVDVERIRHGVELTKNKIHAGWARKGTSGIFQKDSSDLEGGASVASEIRMLQLPQTDQDFLRLMKITQWGVNAIADVRSGRDTDEARDWMEFQSIAAQTLEKYELPNSNWMKDEVRYDVWERFCKMLPEIQNEFRDFFEGESDFISRNLCTV